MKIADYELSRIEAKVVGYYQATGVSFIHEPNAKWKGWGGAYVMENGKQKSLRNTIVITACTVDHPGTPKEEFQTTVIGPRELFRKVGNHNKLNNYMAPIAANMNCLLEVNYSKHYSSSGYFITITMKRKNEN